MVEIIRLHSDPHEEAQKLLAWYVNGSLEADETMAVEGHLADCAECRGDLKLERALSARIAGLPADVEPGWAKLRDRVQSEPARRGAGVFAVLLRRPIPIGWAMLAQAASLVLICGLGWTAAQQRIGVRADYHTLSAASAPAAGNVVVRFKPTTSERALRAALLRSGARLVDGPTATDAYVLRIGGDRDEALKALRADADVALAEPIDGDDRP